MKSIDKQLQELCDMVVDMRLQTYEQYGLRHHKHRASVKMLYHIHEAMDQFAIIDKEESDETSA